MRYLTLSLVASLVVVACGCSSGWRSKDKLGRRLYVKWPSDPKELDKAAGNYMATLADKRPEGLFLFSASIQASAEGLTDDEAAKVVDVVVGLLGEEISRKPIEFGGKKLEGLDVTHRGNSGNVIRSVVVRSRTRIYTVSVSVPSEEALSNRDVVKFCDSLKIDD